MFLGRYSVSGLYATLCTKTLVHVIVTIRKSWSLGVWLVRGRSDDQKFGGNMYLEEPEEYVEMTLRCSLRKFVLRMRDGWYYILIVFSGIKLAVSIAIVF